MKTSHHTHPRYQIPCLQPMSLLPRLTCMGAVAFHQQASLLHRLSSSTMDLKYMSSGFRGMEEHHCSSRSTALLQTFHLATMARSMMVIAATPCRIQGDGTRSPFVHQPPSLTGWHQSPSPQHSLGCPWGSSIGSCPLNPSSWAGL